MKKAKKYHNYALRLGNLKRIRDAEKAMQETRETYDEVLRLRAASRRW